jgi:hypothetical protein
VRITVGRPGGGCWSTEGLNSLAPRPAQPLRANGHTMHMSNRVFSREVRSSGCAWPLRTLGLSTPMTSRLRTMTPRNLVCGVVRDVARELPEVASWGPRSSNCRRLARA